jgi:uncharacterized protein YkwD
MHTRTPRRVRARLAVTRLEDRTVPAVTATLRSGVLSILGDAAANVINVGLANGQITVSGVAQTFAANQVTSITVDGSDGDDVITVSPAVTTPCLLFGGFGSDRITGGSGADQLYGGIGGDTLDGSGGNDQLYSGAGADIFADTQGSNAFVRGGPNRTAGLSALEAQILALINQQRQANGLAPLAAAGQLQFAAVQHSANMAAASAVVGLGPAMSHTLDGSPLPTVVSRADYAGYSYQALGENIAYGFTGAADVVQAWMNSAGHRANILNPGFAQVGIGVRANPAGVLYFTQEFGTPAPAPAGSPVPPAPPPSPHLYAVGADAGGPQVIAYDAATGRTRFSFFAYDPRFRGGVRVATGDVTGDGYDDVVTAAGPGGAPAVRVFDGRTGQLVRAFTAYSPGFRGGVYVAVGDVTGDGRADIVTGTGVGGGPHVKVFDGRTGQLAGEFMAYDPNFRGGVVVAAGDVTGDGRADVVTGTGPGGGPHVKVFDGRSLTLVGEFMALAPGFHGGVTVATGDVNGDGRADIVTGQGPGGVPCVRVFDGASLALLQDFTAYAPTFAGGVRVATADLDGDGAADLLVGPGTGLGPQVKVFEGRTLAPRRTFSAFDPAFLGGVFVG